MKYVIALFLVGAPPAATALGRPLPYETVLSALGTMLLFVGTVLLLADDRRQRRRNGNEP